MRPATMHLVALLAAVLLFGCASEPTSPAVQAAATPVRPAPIGYEIPEPVPDAGWDPLDVTFTRTLPGGYAQQVPDQVVGEPTTVEAALAAAFEELRVTREAVAALGPDAPLTAGVVAHHGHEEVAPEGDIELALDADQFTPVTVYNVCTTLTLMCARDAGTIDGCLDATPTCASPEPWLAREDCCPKACKKAYFDRRDGGESHIEAYSATFVHDWSCFAGMPGREPHGEPEGGE